MLSQRPERQDSSHSELKQIARECPDTVSREDRGAAPDEFMHVCREYSDRILYGTDMSCRRIGDEEDFETKFLANVTAFHMTHFLFLGTSQKMIPTPFSGNRGKHFVGRAYGGPLYANDGVALPDGILEKIYYKNFERLFGIRVPDTTRPTAEE